MRRPPAVPAALLVACAQLAPCWAAPPDRPRARDEEIVKPDPGALTPQALCRRGEHEIEKGTAPALRSARRLFETALTRDGESVCAHAGLSRSLAAILLHRVEEEDALVDRALEHARRAVQIEPASPDALAALAGALLADLRHAEAHDAVTKALQAQADFVPALQTAVLVHAARGDLDAAGAAAERALALRPDLPAVHHALGNVRLLTGREPEAVDAYRNALALEREYIPSMLQLGAAYEQMGDFTTAGAVFKRLLAEHPEAAPRAYLYMGHSLMKRRSWTAALGAFEKVAFRTRRGLSDGTVLYLKGVCYEQLGRDAEARAAFREVIDEWPDATRGLATAERLIFPAYEGLGRIYLKARQMDEAVTVMEEGAARPDATLDLFLRLARLYLDYRIPDRATSLLERAVGRRLVPEAAGSQMAAYVLWARTAAQTGDAGSMGRLIASLEGRLAEVAAFRDVLYELEAARALSIAGRGELALECLRRAVAAGYTHFDWMARDEELRALRETPGFSELAASAASKSTTTD